MEQFIGHTFQLRVRLRAPIWHLGSGWAALGGVIASGLLNEGATPPLARVGVALLVWLLADPVLGTLWELGTTSCGVWTQLWRAASDIDHGTPVLLLPYTQVGSPAWRAASWLGRRRVWWRTTFWPQNGEAFSTICALLPVALLVGALLTPVALMWVCAAIALAWLVALWRKGTSSATGSHLWRINVADAWVQFGIPWMIGCAAVGKPVWLGIALGVCLTFSYMGLSRQPVGRLGVLAGQLAGLVIVLGMRQMLISATISVLLIAQAGLLFAQRPDEAPAAQFRNGLHILVLGVMLISAFTVGLG